MATPLPWRKFPRDLMVKPEIQYIIKRLAPEKKHAVFTVITALYCYADDSGVVDITDRDLFTDICLFENEKELLDIIDRLEARKLVSRVKDNFIQIEGWDPPILGAARTTGESWGDRLQRTKTAARREPDEPTPAELAAMAMGESAYDTPDSYAPEEQVPMHPVAAAPVSKPPVVQKRKRKIKKNQNDTETKIVSVSQQTLEERVEETRREQSRGDETREDEKNTHTQISAPLVDSPTASGEPCPPFGDGQSTSSAKRAQQSSEKEKTDTKPRKRDPPEKTRSDKNTLTDKSGTGTGEKVYQEGTEKTTASNTESDTGEENSWLWSKVKNRLPPGGIPGNELEKPWTAFYTYFKRQNPGGFADQTMENEAITALSVRAHGLGNAKTPPEIVACTMVGAFQRLINSGGYFTDMPCTPSMLLKPGNYQKVLAKVSKTIFPRGNLPSSWKRESEILAEEAELIKKEIANEDAESCIALHYERFGINPEDPQRFVKLQAAKKASGE